MHEDALRCRMDPTPPLRSEVLAAPVNLALARAAPRLDLVVFSFVLLEAGHFPAFFTALLAALPPAATVTPRAQTPWNAKFYLPHQRSISSRRWCHA